MPVAYKRCSECEGTGLLTGGLVCPVCEGWGGYWIVLGGGGLISVRIVPGDADNRPEDPTKPDA